MNILYIDIETSPNVGMIFDLWNQNISLAQLQESGTMLCFAAIWGATPSRPIFHSVWDDGFESMVEAAWALLDDADVVVHYNGRRFDVPWLNSLFRDLGLPPPSPFKQVDLYTAIKSQFRLPSYKLAYVAERWLSDSKMQHEGFSLWVKVMAGDPAAQRHMRRYCIKDTKLLLPLFEKLLPWIPRLPNIAIYREDDGVLRCRSCGSDDLTRQGFALTQTRRYQRYRCSDCKSWMRATRSESGVDITETPLN